MKLRFTGREGDRFSFECHGNADTAVFVSDGDRIIWGDGCVYMRIRTPEKDVDIVGTTISEKILESGTAGMSLHPSLLFTPPQRLKPSSQPPVHPTSET